MTNYFEAKIKYEKTLEEGKIKKVTETYLVDAISFTEAEERITKEMKPFISGEFDVKAVAQKQYAEIFKDTAGDKWYKAKVMFITIDEEKGVEKRKAHSMLVQADCIDNALANLRKGMGETMIDYEIHTISETMIMDIFEYKVIVDEEHDTQSNDFGI